jgi:hypothetical protein
MRIRIVTEGASLDGAELAQARAGWWNRPASAPSRRNTRTSAL